MWVNCSAQHSVNGPKNQPRARARPTLPPRFALDSHDSRRAACVCVFVRACVCWRPSIERYFVQMNANAKHKCDSLTRTRVKPCGAGNTDQTYPFPMPSNPYTHDNAISINRQRAVSFRCGCTPRTQLERSIRDPRRVHASRPRARARPRQSRKPTITNNVNVSVRWWVAAHDDCLGLIRWALGRARPGWQRN